MTKRTCFAVCAVFLSLIGLFFILHLALPDRDFSPRENRYLEEFPRFSLSSLFSGDYTRQLETYTTDQFPLRDAWITLKAAAERAAGKSENNGIYLCRDDMLLEAYHAPQDEETLEKNTAAVNGLTEAVSIPVYLALIPGKAEFYGDLLPKYAPNDSEKQVIDAVYAETEASCIDLNTALAIHKDEYIFYRTDHHWTTSGAYYGYSALCGALGITPMSFSAFEPETVSEDFYGTQYSSSGFTWVQPDMIQRCASVPDGLSIENYLHGTAEPGMLYDDSYLSQKDKYAMFLGGNTPLLQIHTETGNAGSILLLRDSFADSLVPFLLPHFSEIHMIDLRYYKSSVLDYIAEHDIDQVLILYSAVNFTSDSNIPLMAR